MPNARPMAGRSVARDGVVNARLDTTHDTTVSCLKQAGAREVNKMARSRVTSRRAARAASKTLASKQASKAAKTAAGSALSQTPRRRGKK